MADSKSPLFLAKPQRSTFAHELAHWLRGLFVTVGAVFVLVTIFPISGWWARAYSGPFEQPRGDVLVILSAANDDHGLISFSSYWRTRYAITAWRSGGFRKIIVSGGGGPGIRDFLAAEGVPSQSIIAEWQSETTHDSGIACANLLRNVPGTKVLITSDFHMYRSVRVFRKAGIDVTPMPVPDVLTSSKHWNSRVLGFEIMAAETIKIVYYRLRGWI